jgi:TonB-dependent SusC/RagA subfamily outer membrane receptor
MPKHKIFFAAVFSVSVIFAAHAQDRVIYGVVTTFDSIPLAGANIKAKSTKLVVSTDSLGRFFISCDSQDVITVYAQGFYPQKAKLSPENKYAAINLKMKPGVKNKEYSYGYFSVSDREKINAIDRLSNDNNDFSTYANIYDLIIGRFAGVQVVNGQIIIRGNKSVTASDEALIILDGMQIDGSSLSNISPSMVKSIDVIKDGSTAIYGSRGGNGVVIIKTKNGE